LELGEVKAALLASPLATAAAATLEGDVLYGYVAVAPEAAARAPAATGRRLIGAAVRVASAALLPPAAVPPHILVLPDGLPLTPSGKVDRGALSRAAAAHAAAPSAAGPPATPTEEALARVWAAQLGIGAIASADADFYALGGDSLTALRCVRLYAIRELGIDENDAVFGGDTGEVQGALHPTELAARRALRAYAAFLDSAGRGKTAPAGTAHAPQNKAAPASGREIDALLMEACSGGFPEVAAACLAAGADPDGGASRRCKRRTPLHAAAAGGCAASARLLVAAGAAPSLPKEDGVSPLMQAAERGHVDVIRVLLAAGAPVAARCRNKQHVLHCAARSVAGLPALAAFLDELWPAAVAPVRDDANADAAAGGPPISWRDRWHRTPLHWAAAHGYVTAAAAAAAAAAATATATPTPYARRHG